jgi:hypothetical protein
MPESRGFHAVVDPPVSRPTKDTLMALTTLLTLGMLAVAAINRLAGRGD